jgi:hypothetical protein
MWPRQSRDTTASSTTARLPTTTFSMLEIRGMLITGCPLSESAHLRRADIIFLRVHAFCIPAEEFQFSFGRLG